MGRLLPDSLALLLVFPLGLRRTLFRYRPYQAGELRSGQSALLGGFMALLSFIAFLIFSVSTISLKREPLLDRLHELAAQNPDPQVQQMMLWFTTNTGFIVIIALTMLIFLVIFLVVGFITGALMSGPSKKRP
jgi:ABC-type antimicrobial peptide transport system permease subunit